MSRYATSGALRWNEAKGLHRSSKDFWIELPEFTGQSFEPMRPVPGQRHGCYMTRGRLHVPAGYLWDGSSGPTVDGKADPVPSLVHDVLAEAHRQGVLRWKRLKSDGIYYRLLCERGMTRFRAGLRRFGLFFGGWRAFMRRSGSEYPSHVSR